ncbi:hypothetical protein [Streptomyces hydrogenans]|uniref:hypothetical protein n=1 Tax=Streptomyces hydrogenans TaxID=1873719 RepID=UPI003D73E225
MTEIQTRALPAFRCEYLDAGGADLSEGAAAFVSLDLIAGALRAYSTTEYATVAPALVAACWSMRWPIAPIPNDRANALLDAITPHARELTGNAITRTGELGVQFIRGAGQSIDAIQRLCAATWAAA